MTEFRRVEQIVMNNLSSAIRYLSAGALFVIGIIILISNWSSLFVVSRFEVPGYRGGVHETMPILYVAAAILGAVSLLLIRRKKED